MIWIMTAVTAVVVTVVASVVASVIVSTIVVVTAALAFLPATTVVVVAIRLI